MKKRKFVSCIIMFTVLLSCNPECDNVLNISVDSFVKQQNQEMLVTADDPSTLQSSEIQFVTGSNQSVAKSKFMPGLGLIVTVPENVEGDNVQLVINDPDCGTAVLSSGITVGNEAFFLDNPAFIPPAPFEFVIPAPPVAFPPLVQNAWISPQNNDYCVWFQFVPARKPDGEIDSVQINGVNVTYKETISIDPARSFELSVRELLCENGAPPGTPEFCTAPVQRLYHCNPVSGIVDRENNIVHFWIDRTDVNGQNLGIEEFVGEFINIQEAGYDVESVPSCSSAIFEPTKTYLMLVTSQTSGRQLLLYQQGFK